ncbi:MAG TPA: FkbM family methyltransferase [Longimicrobiaceae bacterium]|nr:FkbM family methyltransferase [Longimicrobiaceae bacterium]
MLRDAVIDALRPYHFRGKLRMLGSLAPRRGERVARVFGYDVRLDLGEAIQWWIYLGAFEPRETAIVRSWLRPGMTFLDVGANFGYFTLLAASRVGESGRVLAVEPSPYAYGRLVETVHNNALPQVQVHQLGLSTHAGTLNLYLSPSQFHSPTMSASSGGEPVEVPVRRLDDCMDEWGVGSIDLMKLDVEGHEPFVLAGASRVLDSGRIRAVLCEFNDHWLRQQGSSPQALYDMFLRAGFVDVDGRADFAPSCCDTRFLVHRSTRERPSDLVGPAHRRDTPGRGDVNS